MTKTLSQELFSQHLDETFQLNINGEDSIELSLIEVTGASEQLSEQAQNENTAPPYSLLFLGPAEPLLPQAIYTLEHEHLGAQDLFLVPLGPYKDGMSYEAVFN